LRHLGQIAVIELPLEVRDLADDLEAPGIDLPVAASRSMRKFEPQRFVKQMRTESSVSMPSAMAGL
jgi:hypothetical protein